MSGVSASESDAYTHSVHHRLSSAALSKRRKWKSKNTSGLERRGAASCFSHARWFTVSGKGPKFWRQFARQIGNSYMVPEEGRGYGLHASAYFSHIYERKINGRVGWRKSRIDKIFAARKRGSGRNKHANGWCIIGGQKKTIHYPYNYGEAVQQWVNKEKTSRNAIFWLSFVLLFHLNLIFEAVKLYICV